MHSVYLFYSKDDLESADIVLKLLHGRGLTVAHSQAETVSYGSHNKPQKDAQFVIVLWTAKSRHIIEDAARIFALTGKLIPICIYPFDLQMIIPMIDAICRVTEVAPSPVDPEFLTESRPRPPVDIGAAEGRIGAA